MQGGLASPFILFTIVITLLAGLLFSPRLYTGLIIATLLAFTLILLLTTPGVFAALPALPAVIPAPTPAPLLDLAVARLS